MRKFKKNGGFTLVEMLIVVAIIAILIAISIPLVSSTLEKARHSVDDANLRDAQSLATVYYLTMSQEQIEAIDEDGITLNYMVNANQQGKVVDAASGAAELDDEDEGDYVAVKATCTNGADCTYSDGTKRPTNGTALTVTINKQGEIVTTSWTDDATE